MCILCIYTYMCIYIYIYIYTNEKVGAMGPVFKPATSPLGLQRRRRSEDSMVQWSTSSSTRYNNTIVV